MEQGDRGYVFCQATAADQDEIVRITRAGREYLAAQGLDQWQGGNPSPERVAEDITCGYDYLAVDSQTGERLGVVAVCGVGEPDYDNVRAGAWLTDSPNDPAIAPSTYLVLHRMAVSPEARHRGVASFMMREALEIARERGFASVRVDTHENNLLMQNGFIKCGFERCCEIEITSPLEPTKKRIGFEVIL